MAVFVWLYRPMRRRGQSAYEAQVWAQMPLFGGDVDRIVVKHDLGDMTADQASPLFADLKRRFPPPPEPAEI